MPLEYYDSDDEDLKIFITDLNDIKLFQKIAQKVNSIRGIRKMYFNFKSLRRECLSNNNLNISLDYMQFCIKQLKQLEALRAKNLSYVLAHLGGISMKQYDQNSAKMDKDYFSMIGLAKRMRIPDNLTLDQAKELKIKMQERVMELWNEQQKIQQQLKSTSQFDME